MNNNYNVNNPVYWNRTGDSLNLAVNYITDVLHTLYVSSIQSTPSQTPTLALSQTPTPTQNPTTIQNPIPTKTNPPTTQPLNPNIPEIPAWLIVSVFVSAAALFLVNKRKRLFEKSPFRGDSP